MKPYIEKIIVCKNENELLYLLEVHIMCNGSLSKLLNGKVITEDPAGQKSELKDYFAVLSIIAFFLEYTLLI